MNQSTRDTDGWANTLSAWDKAPKVLQRSPDAAFQTVRPYGIGGWLLLLIIAMMVFAPFFGWARTALVIRETGIGLLPEWGTFRTILWAAYFIAMIIYVYSGFSLITRREPFSVRQAQIALWVGGPLLSVFCVIALLMAAPHTIERSAIFAVFGKTWGSIIGQIIAAAIWTAYLAKSKRVRDVYFPRQEQQEEAPEAIQNLGGRSRPSLSVDEESKRRAYLVARVAAVLAEQRAFASANYADTNAAAVAVVNELWSESSGALSLQKK